MSAADALSGVQFVHHSELAKMYSGDYDVPMGLGGIGHMREARRDHEDGFESPHGGWTVHGGPDEHVTHLQRDIAANGMREPIEVRGGNVITDGHHRAVAALRSRMERVPVRHVR